MKKAFHGELPHEIFARTKQPYGDPNKEAFFKDGKPRDSASCYLDDEALNRVGVFDPLIVQKLLRKCAGSSRLGFRDNSAFMGILSTQILAACFVILSVPDVCRFELKTRIFYLCNRLKEP